MISHVFVNLFRFMSLPYKLNFIKLGSALIKVGDAEAKIGVAEREFVETSARKFIKPCKSYIENDCKSINVCIVLLFHLSISCAFDKNLID